MTLVIVILIILALLLIRGLYEPHTLAVTNYDIESNQIPEEFDQCKLVMLTDLHNNVFGKNNHRLINEVKNLNPDYILIGGDMLMGHPDADNTSALELVKQLAKDYPVYYANGNHEQRLSIYPESRDTSYLEYVNQLKEAGVHHLINERINITRNEQSIDIIALEIDQKFFKKGRYVSMSSDYITNLIGDSNSDRYEILLAHTPVYFHKYAEWGADLVLSGHLHGGMMRLPVLGGVLSPQLVMFPRYNYGIYKKDKSTMILSGGLGVHTIRIRLFNKPEIISIRLIKI